MFAARAMTISDGDSLRPYGLGMMCVVLVFALIWKLTFETSRIGTVVLAAIVALLSVQSLYLNGFVAFGICLAGIVVAVKRREFQSAAVIFSVGIVAAISLLPYVGIINSARELWPLQREERGVLDASHSYLWLIFSACAFALIVKNRLLPLAAGVSAIQRFVAARRACPCSPARCTQRFIQRAEIRFGKLIHVALVAFVGFELLDVSVRFVYGFAALFLDDLSQRSIDIFGHTSRVAAHEKLRTVVVDPFPNLSGVFQHLMLNVNFVRLIARPRAIQSRQKAVACETFPVFFVGVIALLALRSDEEPVFSFRADSLSLLQKPARRRDASAW